MKLLQYLNSFFSKIVQRLFGKMTGNKYFPNNCLKGIPNENFMYDDGTIASHLFHYKNNQNRNDGFLESSINWEDDSQAIRFTLNQRKENNELQFNVGIAIIPRFEIDRINRQPTVNGILFYERQAIPKVNPYHGNLLIGSEVPKPTMKKIAASIALVVSQIITQNHN